MDQGRPLRILLAASEVVGFAKTGGLADVVGSLPQALARRGHKCAVIMPLYRACRRANMTPSPTDRVFWAKVGDRSVWGRLWRSSLPGDVPVYLVENDGYFDREGLYQHTSGDGSKHDYGDNCERFIFFNRAVMEALPLLDDFPEILHVHDWQAGLIPVYARELYRTAINPGLDPQYDRLRSLLTIHNIAFQGNYWHWDMKVAGLPWHLFNPQQMEFHNKMSFLKGAVVFADLLNTVSPTYAHEIQTPYFGWGMQGVLYHHRNRLSGILNGVDYAHWDPRHDPHIAAPYGPDDLSGKAACKRALQQEMGLPEEPDTPLFGVVARLTDQKGCDLIAAVLPGLLDKGYQIVILGEGDPKYHHSLGNLQKRYASRFGLLIGFNEELAHRIEAGADIFLMPSAFEPCGLNQFYSLRYGTPPVVRATGGLADSVTDTNEHTLADGTATGFRFTAHTAHALWETAMRAVGLWLNDRETWRQVMTNGMRQDWSWDRSATEYEGLFRRLTKED